MIHEAPERSSEQSSVIIPPEFRPEPYKSAGDLAVDVTIWTRDKIDDEGILLLQERANRLLQLALNANPDNVESDQDYEMFRLKNEIVEVFDILKRKRGVELGERCIRALEEKTRGQNFEIMMRARGLEQLLVNRPHLAGERGASDVRDFLFQRGDASLKSQPFIREFAKDPEKFAHIVERMEEELKEEPRGDESDYVLAQYQYLFPLLKAHELNLKWIRALKGDLEKRPTEDAMRKRVEPLLRVPALRNLIETSKFSADSDTTDKELERVERAITKWFEEKSPEVHLTYNFISKRERDSTNKRTGGADYNDYVFLNFIRNENGTFSTLLSEKLGVRTFMDHEGGQSPYRIHALLEELREKFPEAKMTNPLARDESMEHAWRDYGHVDLEYRQMQAKIEGVDKNTALSLCKQAFANVRETRSASS